MDVPGGVYDLPLGRTRKLRDLRGDGRRCMATQMAATAEGPLFTVERSRLDEPPKRDLFRIVVIALRRDASRPTSSATARLRSDRPATSHHAAPAAKACAFRWTARAEATSCSASSTYCRSAVMQADLQAPLPYDYDRIAQPQAMQLKRFGNSIRRRAPFRQQGATA